MKKFIGLQNRQRILGRDTFSCSIPLNLSFDDIPKPTQQLTMLEQGSS